VHETRDRQHRLRVWTWFFQTLPQTFRRRARAFSLSLGITIAGALFGGFATALDPGAKETVLPEMFANHLGDPAERVAKEESNKDRRSAAGTTVFSRFLLAHETTYNR